MAPSMAGGGPGEFLRGEGLLRRLGVEPGETAVFAWGAATLFLLGWAEVSLKIVADTLFIKRIGVERLWLAWVVSDLVIAVCTAFTTALASRSDRLRLLPRVIAGAALAIVPLWLLVVAEMTSGYAVLVVTQKLFTSVILLVFWIAMGDLLTGRQSKRLFAPMTAGLTVGTIGGSAVARLTGPALAIPMAFAAFLLCAATALPLRRARPRLDAGLPASRRAAPSEPGGRRARLTGASLGLLWRESGLFRLLLVVSLSSGMLAPMLHWEFNWLADASTRGQGGEELLYDFFARFYQWLGGVVLLAQLFGTSFVFRWIGRGRAGRGPAPGQGRLRPGAAGAVQPLSGIHPLARGGHPGGARQAPGWRAGKHPHRRRAQQSGLGRLRGTSDRPVVAGRGVRALARLPEAAAPRLGDARLARRGGGGRGAPRSRYGAGAGAGAVLG
jgi:hypothetical protein